MIIRVDTLAEEGLHLIFEEPAERFSVLSDMEKAGDCSFLSPIRIDVQLHKAGEFIHMKGQVQIRVALDCGRCMERIERDLQERFALTYIRELPEIEDAEKDGVELNAEDMGLMLFDGEKIMLDETVQEQVVLAIPYRLVCSEDCRGLCSRCGRNLNTGVCNCGDQQAENPFSALKELKLDS